MLPPSDVTAQVTGTSTILLLWGPVPQHGTLGIIVGYDVAYTRPSDPARPKKAACSTSFRCELKNLDFGTRYTIFVSGVTSKGVGANASVEAVTFKAGKNCVELFQTKTVLVLTLLELYLNYSLFCLMRTSCDKVLDLVNVVIFPNITRKFCIKLADKGRIPPAKR